VSPDVKLPVPNGQTVPAGLNYSASTPVIVLHRY
jgi:hypothetical protein